jgi:hypothetical protein
MEGPSTFKTIPLTRAFAVFRKVCLDTFPDPDAFDGAVEKAGLGFVKEPATRPGWHRWSQGGRYLTLELKGRMEDGRAFQQCRFRVAVPEELSEEARMKAIGDALAPGRPHVERYGLGAWDLGGDEPTRLELLPASPDTRVFDLSVRRFLKEEPD